MKAFIWGAIAGLALMGANSASAIDLTGKIIVIDGLWSPYSAEAPKPQRSEITIRSVGNVLFWDALVPTSCLVNGRLTHISLVFGPQASRSEPIACDVERRGTESSNAVSNKSADFTSSYANNGDILTLSGQMTFRDAHTSTKRGPTPETMTVSGVYQIRQAAILRVSGGKCEVLNFDANGTGQETARFVRLDTGQEVQNSTTTKHTRLSVPDRFKCAVMSVDDYKPRISGLSR